MRLRILLAEDDVSLARVLTGALTAERYAVDHAPDGEEALHRMVTAPYDAVVLDVNLPRLDGLAALAKARAEGMRAPVLLLTARTGVGDRVRGLDAGADDYLVKPFAPAELFARLRALLRRGAPGKPAVLCCGDLTFDPATRAVARGGVALKDITPRETELLEYLLRNAGSVVTRTMISEHVWGEAFESFANVIDVHVAHLRRKLERGGRPRLIHTVRGAGFLLRDAPP